jgi:hypothetical protein
VGITRISQRTITGTNQYQTKPKYQAKKLTEYIAKKETRNYMLHIKLGKQESNSTETNPFNE